MSWLFSQALVEEYLAGNSSAGGQSAPSSGKPTHGMFWSPDKTTDASKPSQSGMTFKPSTDDLGEDLLTWYLAASLAKTLVQPVKAQESKENDHPCGNTWRESSAKFDRNTHSWKTHRCLWEEDLPSSSLTLPKWGMMRNGVLWERITPPPLISGTESGCWVGTPTATMSCRSEAFAEGRLPQPAEFVKMWPTPRAGNPGSRPNGKGGKILSEEVLIAEGIRKRGETFATPQARDFRTGQQSRGENPERTRNLNDQIGGQLNPTWVEWLMGWPLGWTDCAVSATDKFRLWLNSHGKH